MLHLGSEGGHPMYRDNLSLVTIASVLLGIMFGGGVASALPDDQTIDYSVYATPTDPESAVVFIASLTLVADSASAEEVGWEVTEIRFTQPGEGSNPDIVWVESTPVVESPDGLWWVDHADVENPVDSEFVMPPLLTGTALPEDPAEDDLDYTLEGVTYTPPQTPEEPPHATTAAMDYSFQRAMAQAPIEEEEDELVEVIGVNDPS
jgi:hypothetical protein